MLTQEDMAQLRGRGVSRETIEEQLRRFREGFPPLRLKAPALVGEGITRLPQGEPERLAGVWDAYLSEGRSVTKFVPASGAASRMFKALFEFLDSGLDAPSGGPAGVFCERLRDFAFFDALSDACLVVEGKSAEELLDEGDCRALVRCLLDEEGLGYGRLPKALLQFHAYEDAARTPLEEHLEEAALYAASRGVARVHFTVGSGHRALFQGLLARAVPQVEERHGVRLEVTLSEQLPSTDTVAANMDNTPLRDEDGRLVFRPGGHGALLANLAALDSDVVFIKNIDNVVTDRLKGDTALWKRALAGALVEAQARAFAYLRLLDTGRYTHADLEKMIRFTRHTLCTDVPGVKHMEDTELHLWLRRKLDRPMRAVGVVPNQGEPGGGPFLAYNPDGSVSPQILESSQIDRDDPAAAAMLAAGTHFNPVDIVCGLRDYRGRKFDLRRFTDPATGFISLKSKGGRELKALELPGLWNGSMSDWSTLMVEVPLSTFNPVKTVNDLLRPQHQ